MRPQILADSPTPCRANESGFLSLRQAAKWAGVSTKTLKRWIARGLPKYQAGHRSKVLIRTRDIEEFLTRFETPQMELNGLVDEVMKDLCA